MSISGIQSAHYSAADIKTDFNHDGKEYELHIYDSLGVVRVCVRHSLPTSAKERAAVVPG